MKVIDFTREIYLRFVSLSLTLVLLLLLFSLPSLLLSFSFFSLSYYLLSSPSPFLTLLPSSYNPPSLLLTLLLTLSFFFFFSFSLSGLEVSCTEGSSEYLWRHQTCSYSLHWTGTTPILSSPLLY